jgi:trehalose synthase
MSALLDEYRAITGDMPIDELIFLSERIRGRKIRNINSTAVGGGVAEILARMIPLMKELELDVSWDVITGGEDFFHTTKAFHNALHGKKVSIRKEMFDVFHRTTERNLKTMDLSGDILFVHDPQPAGLIQSREDGQKWIWRCHVDVSNPFMKVWKFLEPIIVHYDASVFSTASFAKKLPIRQFLIAPSIDPLSDKNRELPPDMVERIVSGYGIDLDRPIITQVSRFDRLKDPLGVIEAYKIARRHFDCQLVLAGGGAADDPEASVVLKEIKEKAEDDRDIFILEGMETAQIEINALQRASTIVLQKSIREGFGLTVAEALWKRRPVIAGAVGGIRLQVRHNITGILVRSVEGTAYAIRSLLGNPDYARKLGENGYQHVKNNYLLTRHLKEHLLLFLAMMKGGEGLIHL